MILVSLLSLMCPSKEQGFCSVPCVGCSVVWGSEVKYTVTFDLELNCVCVYVCVVLQGGGAGEPADGQPHSPQQPLHPGRPWKQLLRHTRKHTHTHTHTTNSNRLGRHTHSHTHTHSSQPWRWAGYRCGVPGRFSFFSFSFSLTHVLVSRVVVGGGA